MSDEEGASGPNDVPCPPLDFVAYRGAGQTSPHAGSPEAAGRARARAGSPVRRSSRGSACGPVLWPVHAKEHAKGPRAHVPRRDPFPAGRMGEGGSVGAGAGCERLAGVMQQLPCLAGVRVFVGVAAFVKGLDFLQRRAGRRRASSRGARARAWPFR